MGFVGASSNLLVRGDDSACSSSLYCLKSSIQLTHLVILHTAKIDSQPSTVRHNKKHTIEVRTILRDFGSRAFVSNNKFGVPVAHCDREFKRNKNSKV